MHDASVLKAHLENSKSPAPGNRPAAGRRSIPRTFRPLSIPGRKLGILIQANLVAFAFAWFSPPVFSEEARGLGEPVAVTGEAAGESASMRTFDEMSSPDRFEHGDPTDYEQLMLEMINRARANPGAEAARLDIDLNDGLSPGTIEDTPKQPLAFHPLLIDAARSHSQWMLDTDTFSHTGIDETSPGDRMIDAGYVFQGSWTWGENIAWGGTTGTPDMTQFTIARHDDLFLSPSHRINLCNGVFDEIGLGVLSGQFTTDRTWNAVMATQKFARSAWSPGPLLVGVIFEDLNGNGDYDPGEGISGVTITPDGGDWYAVSSASGGYAVPYPQNGDTVTVTVSGGVLPSPKAFELESTGGNLKLDLETGVLPALRFVKDSMSFSDAHGFQIEVAGRPGTPFFLDHSTDMKVWTEISTHSLDGPAMTIGHSPEVVPPTGFYRLRWVE